MFASSALVNADIASLVAKSQHHLRTSTMSMYLRPLMKQRKNIWHFQWDKRHIQRSSICTVRF
jgi:hypothetical protein